MKIERLSRFVRGWIVGRFRPTLINTDAVEVAVKRYRSGEKEAAHYHALATEITVVVSGHVRMNGIAYMPDDIIVLEPGEVSDFEVIEDSVLTVVKFPGASNDKYLVST